MTEHSETQAVAERYERRAVGDRYSLLKPDVWQTLQERQRAILRLFSQRGLTDLSTLKLLEVGCGSGSNLLELLRLGFDASHLTGVELLPERYAEAKHKLPSAVALHEGDALALGLPDASQDIVLVSTVFSSLLDDAFQARLAERIWRWVRPGGGVLWYDFTVSNPRNRDVRGVPVSRVRSLFPEATLMVQRVTLAPPLSRLVTRAHPSLYTWFNLIPLLRTHALIWIERPLKS